MTESQGLLWDNIQAFPIDDPGASMPFSARLARDNGWSLDFARRVIAEYRRFLFLAVEAGHPVTPSDEVDQAWHLHLVYTDSYWNGLCRDVLGRPLHHGPTRGGPSEGEKFQDWYARTLASYERFFSSPPPTDIWPDVRSRFAHASDFRRINSRDYWVIPRLRPGVWALRGAMATSLLFMAGCAVSGTLLFGEGGEIAIVMLVALVVFMVLIIASTKDGNAPRKNRRENSTPGIFFWDDGGGGGGDGGDGGDGGGGGCGGGGCGGGGGG